MISSPLIAGFRSRARIGALARSTGGRQPLTYNPGSTSITSDTTERDYFVVAAGAAGAGAGVAAGAAGAGASAGFASAGFASSFGFGASLALHPSPKAITLITNTIARKSIIHFFIPHHLLSHRIENPPFSRDSSPRSGKKWP